MGTRFRELNFERAQFLVPPTQVGQYGTTVDPTNAFNGWTLTNTYPQAMFYGNPYSLYNNLIVGSPGVALIGPRFPNALNMLPLQGSYSVVLQGFSNYEFFGLPGIFQQGVVPADARSITFLTSPSANAGYVTLDGVQIPLYPVAGDRLAGDVTAFAGRNARLVVSTIPNAGWFYFDDVQFSTSSVPEPTVVGLVTFAIVTFALFYKCPFPKSV